MIFSCKEEPTESMGDSTPVISTYYLIRHAEKDRSNPDNPDPELNQKGLGRAMHWAEILDDVALDAIYSTDYERTRMTAAPVSIKQDISVTYYDPANLDINSFKSETLGKKVLRAAWHHRAADSHPARDLRPKEGVGGRPQQYHA